MKGAMAGDGEGLHRHIPAAPERNELLLILLGLLSHSRWVLELATESAIRASGTIKSGESGESAEPDGALLAALGLVSLSRAVSGIAALEVMGAAEAPRRDPPSQEPQSM